jgi:hypothetical protein
MITNQDLAQKATVGYFSLTFYSDFVTSPFARIGCMIKVIMVWFARSGLLGLVCSVWFARKMERIIRRMGAYVFLKRIYKF